MRRAIQQALFIVLASVALGLVVNAVRSDADKAGKPRPIPLVAPPKPALKADETVTLDRAKQLWDSGAAFFLDAREPADFAAGHIANAFNLPAETFEEYFDKVAPMLAPNSTIVAYCNGEDCELSHRVADQLKQRGYADIHILVNGWTVWERAGYPIQTGAGP